MVRIVSSLFMIILVLTSCSNINENKVQNVGLLIEGTIHDQTWGKKGYMGLLEIKDELGVDVYYKEGVNSQLAVNRAIEEFSKKNVNLIFGHSSTFGQYFSNIHEEYPEIQFIYFNGSTYHDNITSMTFKTNAMGFFAGMVAGAMSTNDHVGVIGAFGWQSEIDGFYEGVKFQNPNAKVEIQYVYDWDNQERAIDIFEQFKNKGVDVFYPAGDAFSVPVLKKVKQNGLYGIGYITDQIEMGESTILTSTVLHVDHLYLAVANILNKEELPSGVLEFDFEDGVITMGTFSDEVPENIQNKIHDAVQHYIETGKLPNEVK